MSGFWSWFVVVVTLGSIGGALWLLLAQAGSRRPGESDTTGHEWDGLTERNNPLPRWWLGLFLLTIAFGAGYLAVYPGLGGFGGAFGWTQTRQYDAEVAYWSAREAERFAAFAGLDYADLAADPDARKVGERLFANNCAACHGSDARGAPGFPNLADADWLYGGAPEQIEASIRHGRGGVMPPMAHLGEQGVADVAAYVLSLGGRRLEPPLTEFAARGAATFATLCAACHGQDGTGNTALGAPNLADDIWLYGGDLATLRQTVGGGRNGRMPAHAGLLSDERIRLLTAYVYGLSQRRPADAGAP
jgi:cytochrome c oxidase cbb3-type subunit 3